MSQDALLESDFSVLLVAARDVVDAVRRDFERPALDGYYSVHYEVFQRFAALVDPSFPIFEQRTEQ